MPGFDASAFGDTWVSFRVRQIYPEGDDTSIVCDYALGDFRDRMRVSERHLAPVGAAQSIFGVPMVSLGLRSIRVWQSIVGAIGAPRVLNVNTAQPAGWLSNRFSDEATVDAVEAGKIKQHGDDYSAIGRAILNQVVYPQGWLDMAMPTPRVAHAIGPSGFESAVVNVPVAVARWCGNKAMAMQGADSSAFGTATIN